MSIEGKCDTYHNLRAFSIKTLNSSLTWLPNSYVFLTVNNFSHL